MKILILTGIIIGAGIFEGLARCFMQIDKGYLRIRLETLAGTELFAACSRWHLEGVWLGFWAPVFAAMSFNVGYFGLLWVWLWR